MHKINTAKISRYLIYFILVVLPLERIPSFDLTHPIHATIRLSQVAGLILILINLPLLWQKKHQLAQRPWLPLVAFWLICVISTFGSVSHIRAITVTAYTVFVGLLAWTMALRFERDQMGMYWRFLFIGALATCAFALYQFFGDLAGLSTHWTGLRDQYTSHVFGFPRVQSTGLEPLYYDDYLLIPTGILIGALALGKKGWVEIAGLVTFIAIIFLNVSRGAMVAALMMVVGGIVIALWRRRPIASAKLVAGLAIGGLLALGLVAFGTHLAAHKNAKTNHAIANFSKQTTNISSGESVTFRGLSRDTAIKAAESYPILGVGPGNFGYYANRQKPRNFTSTNGIVNNEPLEILAETGLVGALAFGAFIVMVVVLYIRKIGQVKGDDLVWAVGLGLALVGIAAQYQTFSTLYITHFWVAIGLLIGVLGVVNSKPIQTK